jgi:hypothetical protein
MSVLVATVFKDPYRVAEVLNELQQLGFKWVVDLDQAVVVRHKELNDIKAQFCLDLTTEESAWVSLWGSFLSLILFVPSTEGMVEASSHFGRLSTIILTAVFAAVLLCALPQTQTAQQSTRRTPAWARSSRPCCFTWCCCSWYGRSCWI